MQIIFKLWLSILISFFFCSSLAIAIFDNSNNGDDSHFFPAFDDPERELTTRLYQSINNEALVEDEPLVEVVEVPRQTSYRSTEQGPASQEQPGRRQLPLRTRLGSVSVPVTENTHSVVRECETHPNSPCGCYQPRTSAIIWEPASNSEASEGGWWPYDARQPIRIRENDIPYLRELFQVLAPRAHWLLTKKALDFNWSTNGCKTCVGVTCLCCACWPMLTACTGLVGPGKCMYALKGWATLAAVCGLSLTCYSDSRTKLSTWVASIRFHRKVPKPTKEKIIRRLDTIIERLLEKSRSQLVSLRIIEPECTGINEPGQQVELQIETQIPRSIESPVAALAHLNLLDETGENVTIRISKK